MYYLVDTEVYSKRWHMNVVHFIRNSSLGTLVYMNVSITAFFHSDFFSFLYDLFMGM
jgi:hypothetical protein